LQEEGLQRVLRVKEEPEGKGEESKIKKKNNEEKEVKYSSRSQQESWCLGWDRGNRCR